MEIEIKLLLEEGLLSRIDITFSENGSLIASVALETLTLLLRQLDAFKDSKSIPSFSKWIPLNQETVGKSVHKENVCSTTPLKLLENIPESKTNSPSFSIALLEQAYSEQLQQLIKTVEEGFEAEQEPELCEDGVNGTYFLKNKHGKRIAVFKPQDEEGNSFHNPKKTSDSDNAVMQNLSKGIEPGQAASREVAAYLLDSQHFFHVPPTQMAAIVHPKFNGQHNDNKLKIGSLQQYVQHDGCAEDISVALFPAKEVHRIGVLDILLLNMDRHGGNILFTETEKGFTLIPIDHGFSLPDCFKGLGNAWFDWLNWTQAKQPFDEETKSFIENLDIKTYSNVLKSLGIRDESIKTMKITSALLKIAVARGLTLFDIGSLICREKLEEPSKLELMYQKASEITSTSNNETDEAEFFETLHQIMTQEV